MVQGTGDGVDMAVAGKSVGSGVGGVGVQELQELTPDTLKPDPRPPKPDP